MSWQFALIVLAIVAVIIAAMVAFFYYVEPTRLAHRKPDRFDPYDKDLPAEMEARRTPNEPPPKAPPPSPGRKGPL